MYIMGIDMIMSSRGVGTTMETPIIANQLYSAKLTESTVDHLHVEVGNLNLNDTALNRRFNFRTVMLANFNDDLEAGSIGANDHEITTIQMTRRAYETNEQWQPIMYFPYDDTRNLYRATDRFPKSNVRYVYGFNPIAHEWVGEPVESDPVSVQFNDTFLTDATFNRSLTFNREIGAITHNSMKGTLIPINGKYPVTTFGNSNFRTGNLSALPLSRQTFELAGQGFDTNRDNDVKDAWISFLMNGRAKMLRTPSGNMLVTTSNVVETPMRGGLLPINEISFDYTEIGPPEFMNLYRNGLISLPETSQLSFDENGSIIVTS